MKPSSSLALRFVRLLFLLFIFSTSSSIAFQVDEGVSGSWYNPNQDGQGFVLEVLPNKILIAYWYTYNNIGRQVWLVGAGQIVGNRVTVTMYQTSGGVFGPEFNPLDVNKFIWGNITFTFDSCDTARVRYDSSLGFGSNTVSIVRLTGIIGLRCSIDVLDGTYSLTRASVIYRDGRLFDSEQSNVQMSGTLVIRDNSMITSINSIINGELLGLTVSNTFRDNNYFFVITGNDFSINSIILTRKKGGFTTFTNTASYSEVDQWIKINNSTTIKSHDQRSRNVPDERKLNQGFGFGDLLQNYFD